jgi:enoyl-CoA hydratase/carnithine racemase
MIRSAGGGEVFVIALSREDRRNALTPGMLTELDEAVGRARAARAVALIGDGRVFCAGFDLTLCKDDPRGGVLRSLLGGLSRAIVSLRGLACPVVLGAQGAAIAGGCALLGGADVVVTDPDAKLGYPVTPLGISPGVSAPFLSGAVGSGRARERLLDPSLVSGREAVRIGLAHELVERDAVAGRAVEIAGDLAAKPATGIEATKRLLNELDSAMAHAGRALETSLSLAGGDEEQRLLPQVWRTRAPSQGKDDA